MLVGGGELHETWESLVRRGAPALARHRAASPASPSRWSTPLRRRRRCCRELASHARGARAGGPQRVVRPARAGAGVRARRAGLARPARAVHGGAGAHASPRWCASASWRCWPTPWASRSRWCTGRCRTPLTCAQILCALFPRLCAARADRGRRRGGADVAAAARGAGSGPSPRPGARRRTARICATCPRTPACTCSATSAGGRCTWASRCRCARAPGRTSARRPAGPSAPRSSTTGRPTPSWARWCWRTG